ncbi:MAG TPA: amino-acid N-acetyltransferase [Burkholderiales bacterium]|jgi:amino-acid N-acetyltransferase|nr:amino-acid N-acetyltransferase [Burkholderiales bacterium]
MQALPNENFVQWFRAAAPYIHAFRGRTFVIAFGGEVVADGRFVGLTHDLNLLASLGVKLVLAHGARPQIEHALAARGIESRYVRGVRVTDEATLACVKQANGQLRVEIEALLSMGLPNSPMAGARIRVASGNFVVARPKGVVDGVDMQYAGEVRKIDAEAIRRRLDGDELVLISPVGYSPTGETFNLTVEDVAAQVAIALHADKLIFLAEEAGLPGRDGSILRELTVTDAEALLEDAARLPAGMKQYLPFAIQACRGGTPRVHMISRHLDGALLLELFTHEGVGSMVTRDPLERLREATIEDVGGVLRLIEPLEADGTLVKRSRELLEIEIDRFVVLEHDRVIVGCAALYPFPEDGVGELACLAVHPDYRNGGAGERLLQTIESRARKTGLKKLFVLTTRASHWFVEHGFSEAPLAVLPARKQALYNYQRRSKVLAKPL